MNEDVYYKEGSSTLLWLRSLSFDSFSIRRLYQHMVVYHEQASREARCESNGGPARICTLEGISQQIYSLPRLTASVPTHVYAKKNAREV